MPDAVLQNAVIIDAQFISVIKYYEQKKYTGEFLNMELHGAVILEQGVTFAIVSVKPMVTQYTARATAFRREISHFFPNMPIILMSQNEKGEPRYYGRKDIVDFLKSIRVDQIPWKVYHIY